MARINYVWELGGGLGHLTTGLPLANVLQRNGQHIEFVVKDVDAAKALFTVDTHPVHAAPAWPAATTPPDNHPASYAEILLRTGYDQPDVLERQVEDWVTLFRKLTPDMLVLDFAPTAAIAARILGLAHCFIGHGFFHPPKLSPMPPFLRGTSEPRVVAAENKAVAAINEVCERRGSKPLTALADLFELGTTLLTTWPEIEHYPERREAIYRGPVLMRGHGLGANWPEQAGRRVFVYLHGGHPCIETVLQALTAHDVSALVFAPGISSDLKRQFSSARIRFSDKPYAMELALSEADVLICHGSFGTVWEGLLAGKPMLCLPAHREQQIVAARLARLGVAIVPAPGVASAILSHALSELLVQPAYREAAEAIQRRYAGHDPARQLDELAREILAGLVPRQRESWKEAALTSQPD